MGSTPIKSIYGDTLSLNSGVFAQALLNKYPSLPVIEEPNLSNLSAMLCFQLQVLSYYLMHHVNTLKRNAYLIKEKTTVGAVLQSEASIEHKMSAVNELFRKMNTQQLHEQLMMLRTVLNET